MRKPVSHSQPSSSNKPGPLLVINDADIRRRGFTDAERVLKRLDRLESKLQDYGERDQRLFQDWLNGHFQEERRQVDDKSREYRELARFHNWIVAAAEMYRLTMPEAYRRIRDEQTEFERGSEKIRRRIESERARREAFLEEEMRREFFEAEAFAKEQASAHQDPFGVFGGPRTDEQQEDLDSIRSLSDEELQNVCLNEDAAFELLYEIFELARDVDDLVLLLRIWERVPSRQQKAFRREFEFAYGIPFSEVLKEARASVEPERSSREPREAARTSAPTPGEREENIKLIYRKIVRRLHPDLQGAESRGRLLLWQKKIWDRAQAAQRAGDLSSLERLYRLVLIRSHDLNDLTVGEILESRSWLETELANLEREARNFKRQPAWGFSTRKNLAPVISKVLKSFAADLRKIESDIERIREQHAFLDLLSRSDTPRSRRR